MQTLHRHLAAIARAVTGIEAVIKECRSPVVPTDSLPR